MNYGHMHSCTSSSVAANLLPRDLGRPAIFLLGRAPFAQQKTSKKQLLIANETADSPEHISIIHFINSTHVKWILEPSDVYYPMAYSLLFSCFLYWSWFFWIGYVWWCDFVWIWKTFPPAQWAIHLEKMLWYGKKLKACQRLQWIFLTWNFPDFIKQFCAGQPPWDILPSAWQDDPCSVMVLLQAVGCAMGF